MEKQNGVYPYNGILCVHKKQWSTETVYNVDEPWKDYAKWKQSDEKSTDTVLFHVCEMFSIGKSVETN